MNLNFKISEFIHSDIAIKNNLNNFPDINSLDNILNLIFYLMQPLRNLLKKPIIITSGYRCKKLNSLVGGKIISQHLNGYACDFVVYGMKPNEIINVIKNSALEFDQLINEFNRWIHISYVKNNNRKQILE
ncbi:MAG: hypothetical protein IJ003_06035 [Candidatus Gastranaerophilales bacterium]|nr:hypothetical protein [Candidatus Gastranaerophilales bacterium]